MTLVQLQNWLGQVEMLCAEVGAFQMQHWQAVKSQDIADKGLNQLVSFVDKESEQRLMDGLLAILPGSCFIGEEFNPDSVLTDQPTWIIDPLDGTKEFVSRNGEFAVNIALIENGSPVFGLIASPVRKELIIGSKEFGVYIMAFESIHDSSKWTKIEIPLKINSPLVITCSRSHHSGPILNFIQSLQAISPELEYIKKGSSLKFFDLAMGNADAYPRFAPTMEWDIAAGQAIMETLGGIVYHAETGEPLRYNKENLTNPNFIAKTKALLEGML